MKPAASARARKASWWGYFNPLQGFILNLTQVSNPSLIETVSAPAVAQSGIKMRRSGSSCKGPAVNCCSPVSTNKYRGMLRVVRESTDTCSRGKGGFICRHIHLFVHKQQAQRDTDLQGEDLLYPTRTTLQSSNHKPAGCQATPQPRGWRPSPSKATAEDDAPGSTKPKCVTTS